MQVRDLMQAQGRVFLKSEFGPIGDDWPCLSFTKKSVGDRLRVEFVPGRDVLVYVGTTSPENTPEIAHRSRLLSVVVIEPKQVLETRKIVPPATWQHSIDKYGVDKWQYAMPVIKAAQIAGPPFPNARDVIPRAYRSFAEIENRGDVVEATDHERTAVMELAIQPINLNLSAEVQAYIGLRATLGAPIDTGIKEHALRLAQLIRERVAKGGEAGVRINPQRSAPDLLDLVALIQKKWTEEQKGKCALCGGDIPTVTANKMLQPSADRIDSANGAYVHDNVQVTHLACNFAKNKYGLEDFAGWLKVVEQASGRAGS